jgi:small-conductance mechanosensitive channel
MKGRIHNAILLPSLCCLAFYGGTQLIGETEAAFSSRASPNSITMSAAFVFPATIKQLVDHAQKVSDSMNDNFTKIVVASTDESMEELHQKLAEVTAIEQELTRQLGTLQDLHEELSRYNKNIQNQGMTNVHTFDYVREGFQHVDRLLKMEQTSIDFSHIESIRSSIQWQLEGQKNDKQVTVDEEETMEHIE